MPGLLSDNGSGYIALETRRFAADLCEINPRPDAKTVLEQLPAWFADYNAVHPNQELCYRSPNEFQDAILSPTICPSS